MLLVVLTALPDQAALVLYRFHLGADWEILIAIGHSARRRKTRHIYRLGQQRESWVSDVQ
jgi:hypothetical protein